MKKLFFLLTALLIGVLPVRAEDASSNAFVMNARMFADPLYSKLKGGITESQIERLDSPVLKEVVANMLQGKHDAAQRVKEYPPYPVLSTIAKSLKISEYSRYENPTGIFFQPKDTAVVIVDMAKQEKLELLIRDFGPNGGEEKRYPLEKGVNIFPNPIEGLAYISYYTDDKKAQPVKVHIATGQVNGVFSSALKRGEKKDDEWKAKKREEWKKLLQNAVSPTIDIMGERVQLIYSVESMKKNCPEKGLELIDTYDKIIRLEQEIMGLDKYKLRPKNRMLGRVIWRGFMHADGLGAAFHDDTMGGIGNPDKVPSNSWGIAHEFGHVNQVRPGMKWVSTTEVTNNIYSAWVNFNLNPLDMRLEQEGCNGGDGLGHVAGGRFNAYLNSALVQGEQWLCQRGPDKMEKYEDGGDHFVKLGPLWQLQLYFGVAKLGNPDFYPDIFQIVRNTKEENLNNGKLQLNFMKNACDVSRQNLTDFFKSVGMLKPINKDLDDYSRGVLTITEQDCKQLAAYAKKYPKPLSPVIYYISANSADTYKNKLPVEGVFGEGVSGEGEFREIDHKAWKNVVAFETYKGKDLLKIAMVGTAHADRIATRVAFPKDATGIEAVSWDGKRTLVYGKRG